MPAASYIQAIRKNDFAQFTYTNHRGEIRTRFAYVIELQYGTNEFYPEPQFFLYCEDPDKGYRSFAVSKISDFKLVRRAL